MTISELCVKRPVFAVVLISFLVVLGLFSFRDLGVDLFPRTDPPIVSINVRLAGATPEEVNTQVVMPLEEAITSVSGLDELYANAGEGSGRITARFVLERDIEGAAQDVREKVARALRQLPPNLDPPVIVKADPDADPVIIMAIAGGKNLRETTEIADKQIKRVLETVDGVGEVDISGGYPRQIRIFADAEKLNAYGITINQFERAIQDENVEVPGGTILKGDSQVGVRTLGRIEASSQFGDIIVANVSNTPIRVKDLGRVEDSSPDPTTWSMVRGQEAVSMEIRRQSGTNTLQVISDVKKKLDQVKRTLPPGITIETIKDASIFIQASVTSLEEHLLFGSLLAGLVVLLFIRDWRSVLIAFLAIPASIISTFTLFKIMNLTLNNMTLLGITLAVGIVIDDAIVVLENIVRYIEEKHYEPTRAAIEATKEIMLAVMATTLSLVIIFLPIAFTTGYARRYLNEFGFTMAFSVLVSMLVSFTLTPMLCSRLLKRTGGQPGEPAGNQSTATAKPEHSSKDTFFFRWMDKSYGRMLEWSLDHRAIVILLAIGTFAMIFPLNKQVGRDFIPPDDQNELSVVFDAPVGTSVMGTAHIGTEIAAKIERQIPNIEFTRPAVQERSNHMHIYIRLVDASKRKASNLGVAEEIREKVFPDYKNLRLWVEQPSALGGGDNAGSIRPLILGPDYDKVAELAVAGAERLRAVPGLFDVGAQLNVNNPELQVKIDRQRASDLGVRASDVATAVRLMIAGTDQISTYKEGSEQYDVTMQLLPEQQKNPELLARLMVPSSKLGQVRLDNIATVQRGVGPLRLERYNRQFSVSITLNNAPDFPMDAAISAINRELRKILIPGYSLRMSGTARLLDQTTHDLIIAFLLACIFMYMVLAAQFESFVHPFTIMLGLPLSIPCAFLTLYLTHRTLNLWSALGVLLLLGIVKKNGILQVDYTNRLREQGVPLREAIIQANHVRLRPILMTTFAIVSALIPTATGIGAGGAQRSAIAVTIIGGQSICLLLTLLVTPVAYSLFAELETKRVFAQFQAGLGRLRLGVARVFTMNLR